MASGGFFRGTNIEQDSRYFNQNKKLLSKMSFPKCFDQKVNMKKVKKEVIDQWITEKITGLLGFEDEIVVSMAINLLETKVDEPLNPRHIQISLMGFLEKDCPAFVKELWELLLSAQEHPTGIPPQLLEKKKQEMLAVAKQKDKLRKVLENKRNDSRRSRFDDYSTKRREERIEERKIESKEQERKRRGRSRSRSNENHRQRRLRSRSRSYRRTRRKSPSSSRSPSQSRSRQRHGNVSEDQFGRAKRGSVRKSSSHSPSRRRETRRKSPDRWRCRSYSTSSSDSRSD